MDYLEALGPIARQAGAAILDIYEAGEEVAVATKADASPLTRADLAAHRIILEGLQKLAPEVPVLSEESPPIPLAERRKWRRHFLVDPLDGTKEFLSRNGEFTVNIAYMEARQAQQGLVYAPARGCLYAGDRRRGLAYREDAAGRSRIRTRQVQKPLVAVASRRHGSEALKACLARLKARFGEVQTVSMGSSLKLCLVAEGAADIYPRLAPTAAWDTAAAQAVLEAAGGMALAADGKPLAYPMTETLLNPHFYALGDKNYPWASTLPIVR